MASKAKPVLQPAAQGSGGVDEMAKHLDADHVQFGLLRFKYGSGTFQRVKYIAVHFVGENVGAVKRGRMNSKKGAALAEMGSAHAETKMTDADECTLDNILEEVSSVFIGDDDIAGGESTFSISKMKADYEAMVAEAKKAEEKLKRASMAGGGLKRKTAKELGGEYVTSMNALKAVREDVGAFNWALFTPKASGLPFFNAGSLGINEMRDWLTPDQVLFGIVRMGFGSGTFRRTKWLFLHWSGEEVGAVKRGRANACKGNMHRQLSPAHVDFEATDLDDITIEAVIDKVKRTVVVDGETKGDDAADAFTLEAYLQALQEEAAASAELFGDSGDLNDGGDAPQMSASEIIKLVRDDDGPYTWALFNVKS